MSGIINAIIREAERIELAGRTPRCIVAGPDVREALKDFGRAATIIAPDGSRLKVSDPGFDKHFCGMPVIPRAAPGFEIESAPLVCQ